MESVCLPAKQLGRENPHFLRSSPPLSRLPIQQPVALILIAIALLSGCALPGGAPPPTPTPLPTPRPLVVYATPAVRPWLPALQTCARTLPELALYIEEIPAASLPELAKPEDGLILRLGEGTPPLPFAVSLGEEPLRVVVHPQNPLRSLDREDLQTIFSGEPAVPAKPGQSEPNLQPWVYPLGEEISDLWEQNILDGKPPAAAARLAASPQEILLGVAADPDAIGWLPESWLDASVRAIELAPGLQQELSLPVLAIAASAPQGPARDFLICLQAGAR